MQRYPSSVLVGFRVADELVGGFRAQHIAQLVEHRGFLANTLGNIIQKSRHRGTRFLRGCGRT